VGGCGVISSGANVVPRDFVDLCAAWDEGDVARAQAVHTRLLPLCEALTLETNPIALKAALHLLGRTSDEIRLPLTKLSAPNLEKLSHALKDYGLL
jgi:4-hydroxy-tetrahydrodipicolinate synthase